jgi:hypothetical protein
MLRRIQAGIAVVFQETQEIFTPDKIQLAGLQCFACQFVGFARDRGVQAQDFTRPRDAKDQRLPVARGGRQFHPAAADDVDASWGLTFDKQHCTRRLRAGVLDPLEFLKRPLGKVTEKTRLPQLADDAFFGDLDAVGCAHSFKLLRGMYHYVVTLACDVDHIMWPAQAHRRDAPSLLGSNQGAPRPRTSLS